ncbi:ACP S-malonyltransferase [Balneolales bacterium ANBcel1]|nr:ACP S-malonyltransferase [Balneolales bacterium ANBcel1]
MKKAYLFPGQGSQYKGMGKNHYRFDSTFTKRCDQADEVLGYSITEVMFDGSDADLSQTRYTQPALFLHAYALYESLGHTPDMYAGHSLGEYTALAAAGVLTFEDALQTVRKRGELMQAAGEEQPGAMAAVIGLDDTLVEQVCRGVSEEQEGTVGPANYNAKGQLVISGHETAVESAAAKLKEAGAKLVKKLPVSGAFHSPLMEPASDKLNEIIDGLVFKTPRSFVYSNVTGEGSVDVDVLKDNVKRQLLCPVQWTRTLQTMFNDEARHFIEVGPGAVLQGLVKRTLKEAGISGFQ